MAIIQADLFGLISLKGLADIDSLLLVANLVTKR